MRHSPSDLPSPVEILEARFAELQRAAGDATASFEPADHERPRRTGRQDDRPAGRMTLSSAE